MNPVITLTNAPDSAAKDAAGVALYAYNVSRTGVADRQPVVAVATDPGSGAVLGGFRASPNIIPSEVVVAGTARSYDPGVRDTLERRLGEVAIAHAAAPGCTAVLDYQRGCPAVINDDAAVDAAKAAATALAGADALGGNLPPRTAGDEISFFFNQKPGAFMMIGAGPGPDGAVHNVHTPKYDFNDGILALGAAYWVSVVRQELGAGG